jgi:DUF1009 family protein
MAGQIAPRNLFDLRPDLRAMTLLWRLKEKNAHTVFGAIVEELRKEGVEVIEARPWLGPLMPGKGFRLGPKPVEAQEADVAFGFRIAKELARLDIGQTVVVKNGTVLAVEGFEGTDQCLARGGTLAGREGGRRGRESDQARPRFPIRHSVPGSANIGDVRRVRRGVLAFEAGRSLLLEPEICETLARKNKISVIAADYGGAKE